MKYVLILSLLSFGLEAQNVGIGEPFPKAKLHVNGVVRIDGDSLRSDEDKPATIFHIVSNGGISLKLDANDDGSERFTIKKSGPDLGSVVFELTEGGNLSSDGFGHFQGEGLFQGNLELGGDSRDFTVGENFDLVGEGSVDVYLDSDSDNISADFAIKNDLGSIIFLVEEDKQPTVYSTGSTGGETGGIRFRELLTNGSSSVGIRAADAMSSNIWLTLPATDGLSGQLLQTDGTGTLSWVNPTMLSPAFRQEHKEPVFYYLEVDSILNTSFRIIASPICYLSGFSSESSMQKSKAHCTISKAVKGGKKTK
ncbi:MAG: hypothetical protein ACI9P5_004723, partial [Saprospiraceae bacterium]